jgi:DNA-binding sugar fermentation-stimulating protein
MLFLIQRGDAENFQLARDIDPAYGKAFDEALAAGVEMLCYGCEITLSSINVARAIGNVGWARNLPGAQGRAPVDRGARTTI